MSRKSGMRKVTSLRWKLRRFPAEVLTELRDEVKIMAEHTHFEALKRVPVDAGDLAAALRFTVSRDGVSAKVGAFGARAKRQAFYAHMVEFGTRPGGKRHPNHPGTPAQPFLFPAFEIAKKQASPRIRQALDDAIRKVAGLQGPSDG